MPCCCDPSGHSRPSQQPHTHAAQNEGFSRLPSAYVVTVVRGGGVSPTSIVTHRAGDEEEWRLSVTVGTGSTAAVRRRHAGALSLFACEGA